MAEPHQAARFPTTLWSRVALAGGSDDSLGREALAELCRAYWYPVYAYIRREGNDPDHALDLTQGYFARLLGRETLAVADRGKGRFRALLRADIAFFLADTRDRAAALKRGGGLLFVPLDAEGRYGAEPADELTPDRLFDRAWALSLLDAVVARLKAEFTAVGKADAFEALKVVLTDMPRSVPYAVLAGRLGTTEGAVQVASHRLRRRYRELVREEIAATVRDPAEVEEEIRDLFTALG